MIKIALLILLTSCGKPIIDKSQGPSRNALQSIVLEEELLSYTTYLNFNLLPLWGKVKNKQGVWSGNPWKLNKGGINFRWNSPQKEGFNYLSPTWRELMSMPQEQLARLAPSEKYDLYMGRYDYPLKNEIALQVRQNAEDWEGICHGWAGATLNHPEPQARVMVNPDGLEIPFGSADIKALLSYAYSKVLLTENQLIGKRCGDTRANQGDQCENDLTAKSFHSILSNILGLRGKSVVADLDRYQEVWNHPIISYQSKILAMNSIPNGKIVTLRTVIEYLDVIEKNSWNPIVPAAMISKMTLEYELHLDREGNMTGSKWLSRERPDFLWVIPRPETFEGYLMNVKDLYQ